MGGQFGYFGLWLEEEYGKGHSMAQPKCTTYNSPQLSAQPKFALQMLEVWAVGPEKNQPEVEDDDDEKKVRFVK